MVVVREAAGGPGCKGEGGCCRQALMGDGKGAGGGWVGCISQDAKAGKGGDMGNARCLCAWTQAS